MKYHTFVHIIFSLYTALCRGSESHLYIYIYIYNYSISTGHFLQGASLRQRIQIRYSYQLSSVRLMRRNRRRYRTRLIDHNHSYYLICIWLLMFKGFTFVNEDIASNNEALREGFFSIASLTTSTNASFLSLFIIEGNPSNDCNGKGNNGVEVFFLNWKLLL